mmetsp:Transcript_6594/g.13356  ORF Transcript_6594/g.13356 Transcript_6594/m.13356 type:complete len:112 (-) Transcript_6594:45-380(-)
MDGWRQGERSRPEPARSLAGAGADLGKGGLRLALAAAFLPPLEAPHRFASLGLASAGSLEASFDLDGTDPRRWDAMRRAAHTRSTHPASRPGAGRVGPAASLLAPRTRRPL